MRAPSEVASSSRQSLGIFFGINVASRRTPSSTLLVSKPRSICPFLRGGSLARTTMAASVSRLMWRVASTNAAAPAAAILTFNPQLRGYLRAPRAPSAPMSSPPHTSHPIVVLDSLSKRDAPRLPHTRQRSRMCRCRLVGAQAVEVLGASPSSSFRFVPPPAYSPPALLLFCLPACYALLAPHPSPPSLYAHLSLHACSLLQSSMIFCVPRPLTVLFLQISIYYGNCG
ncbi:hypothetical protein C8R45DRAFT_1039857 [Mycena sanguinolenta]|nr:hypothetical protein C8R45DRAFT_1039857 [Mycena sanguinolenta]